MTEHVGVDKVARMLRIYQYLKEELSSNKMANQPYKQNLQKLVDKMKGFLLESNVYEELYKKAFEYHMEARFHMVALLKDQSDVLAARALRIKANQSDKGLKNPADQMGIFVKMMEIEGLKNLADQIGTLVKRMEADRVNVHDISAGWESTNDALSGIISAYQGNYLKEDKVETVLTGTSTFLDEKLKKHEITLNAALETSSDFEKLQVSIDEFKRDFTANQTESTAPSFFNRGGPSH